MDKKRTAVIYCDLYKDYGKTFPLFLLCIWDHLFGKGATGLDFSSVLLSNHLIGYFQNH